MCEHLKPLEDHLKAEKIPEIFRGQAWSDNCREWIYLIAFLKPKVYNQGFIFPHLL